MAISCCTSLRARGTSRRRSAGPVVGTVMSNLGLEHALAKEGIEFRRAKVGDRYVLELLKETGGVLGGETSGHLLVLDRTTTGDALISALQVLAIMQRDGPESGRAGRADVANTRRCSRTCGWRARSTRRSQYAIQEAVARAERRLGETGRIVLRAVRNGARDTRHGRGKGRGAGQELAKELATSVAQAAEAA